MDPLSITASLIAVLQISGSIISALYEYRSSVKSASKDAARLIEELNSLRAVLENLLSAVEKEERSLEGSDSGTRVDSEQGEKSRSNDGSKTDLPMYESKDGKPTSRLASFQALTGQGSELERCKADLEVVREKLSPAGEGKFMALKEKLTWPFKERDVERLMTSMRRARDTMHFALSADQTVMTLEIHEQVGNISKQFTASNLDKKMAQVESWLDAPDPYSDHATARKKRQPLTGNWFLHGKQYENWRSSPMSFLWLYGIPGCGKSVLCSSIIEDMVGRCRTSTSQVVAYYYFDFNNDGKRGVDSLLRGLLKQLLAKCPTDAECLQALFARKDKDNQLDTSALLQILREFIDVFDETYILIDALDESSEREELMKTVEEILGWEMTKLHILTTSRQLTEIEETVSAYATESVCLQDATLSNDITLLIRERLNSDKKLQKWPAVVKLEIEKTLSQKAHGMFRWVVCQLDILRKCVTLHALRKALDSLPKTLDETYERILTDIDESYITDVQKVLQFLTFSPRPMTLTEMVEVLAIDWDTDEPHFDPKNRIPDSKDILLMCSTLVSISDTHIHSRGGRRLELHPTLRLAHFSVKEYLVSERIKSSKASIYSMSPISANIFIARTYLVYLLMTALAAGPARKRSLSLASESWPLLEPATDLWPKHIGVIQEFIDNTTMELILKFFATRKLANGGNYASWVGFLIPEVDRRIILNTPPLYYAASFGLSPVVKALLKEMPKSEIDQKGGRAIATALHVACFRRQADVVKILLEAGADPKSKNARGESCIYWARRERGWSNDDSIYNMLISHGARPHEPVRGDVFRYEVPELENLVDEPESLGHEEYHILQFLLDGKHSRQDGPGP